MGKIVVALGGNAILSRSYEGTAAEQYASVFDTCGQIADLIADGRQIVITHGNGPQVGNILIQNEEGLREGIPAMPLDVCVAMTQGQIGYLIQRAMREQMERRKVDRPVITVVTQVLVSRSDPAFSRPEKPIGPFYTRERSRRLVEEKGYEMREIQPGLWRRVVPSPAPLGIVEGRMIGSLSEAGVVVIAAGGGGIPVAMEDGRHIGVDAVIDKDLASVRLGLDIEAESLMILTDVDEVMLDFGLPTARPIRRMTVGEATVHLDAGQFPAGSMGPKIQAAVQFVRGRGARAVITSLLQASDAVAERAGTLIVDDDAGDKHMGGMSYGSS